MPKLQNWQFYTQVTLNADKFKPYANMKLLASIVRHNHVNCTKCDHSVSHKMDSIYLICNNASCEGKCLVEYKAYKCPKHNVYIIMKLNEHEEELDQRDFTTKRGITPRVKRLLENLIYEYDIGMPKKLHMKCLTKYKEKIEACTSEAMPTLIQIQDYVRNLRRKLGDTNNIEDIKKYVEEHDI